MKGYYLMPHPPIIIPEIGKGDVVKEAKECGLRSIYILAGTLAACNVAGEVISYEGRLGVGNGVVWDSKS